MTRKKLLWAALAALIVGNTGCCRWCDRWCGDRGASSRQCAQPCVPICCPPAPVCQPVHSSPVSAAPVGTVTTVGAPQWQRCP